MLQSTRKGADRDGSMKETSFRQICNIKAKLWISTFSRNKMLFSQNNILFFSNTDWVKTQSPNDADGGDDDGGAPTTLPSWAQARAHPGQGTNIPFGETPHSDNFSPAWP